MFAVQDIDPRFGCIRALYKIRSAEDGDTEQEIKLVPCDDPGYIPNNPAFSIEFLQRRLKGIPFLCPSGIETMALEGNYGADKFSYVSI